MRTLPALSLALVQALGTLSAQAPSTPGEPDYRVISRKADTLLRREVGTRLELEESAIFATRFAKTTNRVHWNSSTKDQHLVSIVVEPMSPEEAGTTVLTAAILVSVSAVDSLDEGLRAAELVKQAFASDGKPRMVQLGNGVKLFRLKGENEAAKFHIKL